MPVNIAPVIKIYGTDLAADWLNALLEARVEKQYQLPTRVTLRFSDPAYLLVSSAHANLGKSVTLSQYDGAKLADVEITSISSEQRPGEQPELVITGLDKSHRLGRSTRIAVYQQMTYSDIVQRLAQEHGLSTEVDSTEQQIEYLMQAESDLVMLSELARRTGFDWWVDDAAKLHFAKPTADGEVILKLGDNLRSFSARVSAVTPSDVQVDGWDRTKQAKVTHVSSGATIPRPASEMADKADGTQAAFGSAKVLAAGLGAQNPTEAENLAQTVYDRASASSVIAKGVSDGDAAITLGVKVKVEGAGPLSGTYPVTEVEHIFRPSIGFVTRFESGDRRPTTMVDTLGGLTAAGAGVAYAGPAHFRGGVTVGVVTNNKDDDKMGRVKVRFPGMSEEVQTGWARVVSIGGGSKRGSVWIPEVDDEVLIGFEGGDARQPVVIGGLFGNKSTMPETKIEGGMVQSRALTSRLGHVLSFLDGSEPSEQAVEVVLAGQKHKIHLGKDQVLVSVPGGVPVKITNEQATVEFDKQGNIKMEGMAITINAKQKVSIQAPEIELKGQASVNVKADGQLQLSGAMVDVKANGPIKIVGNPVMIN